MSVRRALIALATLVACAAGPGAASVGARALGSDTSFKIRPCSFRGIAAAPTGGVLVRQCTTGSPGEPTAAREPALTNVASGGTVARRPIPASSSGPFAVGPSGEVWLVAEATEGAQSLGLDRLDPDGTLQHFAFPGKKRPLVIHDVALGAEGSAWATAGEPLFAGPGPASSRGRLLRVGADGTEAEFPLPREIEPRDIVLGPDGNLWFTAVEGSYSIEHTSSSGRGYVGRMTPAGAVTVFPTRTGMSGPEAIVAGPDGHLWFQEDIRFREKRKSRIRTIATDGTFGRSYGLPLGTWHSDLAFGPEGALWIAAGEGGLLRLTPGDRLTRLVGLPESIVAGVEGDIWTQSGETLHRLVPR